MADLRVPVHVLKCHVIPFQAIKDRRKTFEVRKNDRFYQSGDFVRLMSYDPDGTPTPGAVPLEFRIGWILADETYGIKPGYIAFNLDPV